MTTTQMHKKRLLILLLRVLAENLILQSKSALPTPIAPDFELDGRTENPFPGGEPVLSVAEARSHHLTE